jgi:patatin-related protein
MGSEQPEVDIGREVRFAIVMYGGVSLAIYINGVAQELYRMVRATAVASDDATKPLLSSAELRGTKRVYRNLGKRSHPGAVGGPDDAEGPIRTRFVVDVLSGTSAGGINAVYLAKALANNQKFDALKRLWIEEGDVQRLINDKEAAERAGIEAQKPPRSLLSSIFMYRNLFDALQSMDGEEAGGKTARYSLVDELDLFVTVTDVVGLPLTLRLLDKPVSEKRYRNVLRFRYDGGRTGRPLNNFRKEYNPLLAFAAHVGVPVCLRTNGARRGRRHPPRADRAGSALEGVLPRLRGSSGLAVGLRGPRLRRRRLPGQQALRLRHRHARVAPLRRNRRAQAPLASSSSI